LVDNLEKSKEKEGFSGSPFGD
jgi:hypothetical protein